MPVLYPKVLLIDLTIFPRHMTHIVSVLACLQPVQYEVVDAHNVVPVWVASNKVEFSARTIRIKLWKKAPDWMQQAFPSVKPQRVKSEHSMLQGKAVDWANLLDGPMGLESLDWTVPEVNFFFGVSRWCFWRWHVCAPQLSVSLALVPYHRWTGRCLASEQPTKLCVIFCKTDFHFLQLKEMIPAAETRALICGCFVLPDVAAPVVWLASNLL